MDPRHLDLTPERHQTVDRVHEHHVVSVIVQVSIPEV